MTRFSDNLIAHKRYIRFYLVFIWLVFLIEKIIAVLILTKNESIFELSGFGKYTYNLKYVGEFKDCDTGYCSYARRMPFIPLLYFVLSYVSEKAIAIGIIKNCLTSIYFFISARFILNIHEKIYAKAPFLWAAYFSLFVIWLSIIRHSASYGYEEGFLVEWMILWSFSFILGLYAFFHNEHYRSGSYLVAFSVIQSLLMYLTKVTMLPIHLLSIGLAFVWLYKLKKNWNLVLAISLSFVVIFSWGHA